MSDQRDWADLLAWRFIGGFSENPRDVERWRETRKIVAAEFRKARAEGLREAVVIVNRGFWDGRGAVIDLISSRANFIEKAGS